MSDSMNKLEKAKVLLDKGLISPEQYQQIQQKILFELGLVEETPSTPEDLFSGNTRLDSSTPTAEVSPFDGATNVGSLSHVPDFTSQSDSNLFEGATNLSPAEVPEGEEDLFSGPTRGMTIMGRRASISDENIKKLPPGTVFDGLYSIVSLLGVGGMGVVYQAVDKTTSQLVALKVLRPE